MTDPTTNQSIKTLFSILPEDDNETRSYWQIHWWNRCYEYSGTRVRFMAGDLLAEMEHDCGGHGGLRFGVELDFAQEDIPEFYLPDNPNAKYDIHHFTAIFWRWGVYLSVRGKVK